MRHRWLLMALACLVFILCQGSANAETTVRASVSPLYGSSSDTLLISTPFTVDIYMNNNDGYERLGYTMTLALNSPDNSISQITHRNVKGMSAISYPSSTSLADSSIVELNSFSTYWAVMNQFDGLSWDGNLPDTISHTTISFSGWPAGLGEKIYIQFALQIDEAGHFCIDSVGSPDGNHDWLFQDPTPTFNGPYCFTVYDPSVPTNQAPVLATIGNKTVAEGANLNYQVTAHDPDGDALTFTYSPVLTNAALTAFNDTIATFNFSPDYSQAGAYQEWFKVSDGSLADSELITITVTNTNLPPVLDAIENQTVAEGANLAFQVTASDPDGGSLIFSFQPALANAVLTAVNGTTASFNFNPDFSQMGVYNEWFKVSDGLLADSQLVAITVTNTNRPPVLTQIATGPLYVEEGGTLAFDVTGSDPDGPVPSLSTTLLPPNATFVDYGDGHGYFEFLPVVSQAGDYPIRFFAFDGSLADTELVLIIVTEAAETPCLEVQPDTIVINYNVCGIRDTEYVHISNCGAGTLNWTVDSLPGWLVAEPTSGVGDDSVGIFASIFDDTFYLDNDTELIGGTFYINAVGATNSPKAVTVIVDIFCIPMDTVLTASPDSIHLALTSGDSLLGNVLMVGEASGLNIPFDASNFSSWLTLQLTDTIMTTPWGLYYDIKTTGLAAGIYVDTIVLTADAANNSPLTVPVILTVNPPEPESVLVALPSSLTYYIRPGDSIPDDSVHIYEKNNLNFEFWAYNYQSWLILDTVSVLPLITPKTIPIKFNTTGLTTGVYIDTIFVYSSAASNYPLAVPVTIWVDTVCSDWDISVTPNSLNFISDGSETISDSVFVDAPEGCSIAFMIYNGSSWLRLDSAGWMYRHDTPASIHFNIYPDTLPVGTYYDTLYISRWTGEYEPLTQVPVVLTVLGGGYTSDSVWISTVPAVHGSDITVPVYFKNDEVLASINLPLKWSSADLNLDSVTFEGTRVAYVDLKPVAIENGLQMAQIGVIPAFTPHIPIGRGLLAKLHFSVSDAALPQFVQIDTVISSSLGRLSFTDGWLTEIWPTFIPGGVVIDSAVGYVCGRVIDTAGNEISDAMVELWDNFPGGSVMLSQLSDFNGQFACHSTGIYPFDAYAYKEGYYPGLLKGITYGEIGFDIVLTPVSPVTPTPEWVDFYCANNYYEGVPLPAGVVVDAYNPEGIHCGTFYVATPGSYGLMPVYRDDPYTVEHDGAQPGDTISFFINGYPATADGPNVWTQKGDIFQVCLDIFRVEERPIVLNEGWNLISWNVDTPNDSIQEILASVSGCVDVVLGFDEGGFTYDPELPEFSTLWKTDHFHGYWIKMSCAETLAVVGVPVAATTPIMLNGGWNLVSYLPDTEDSTPVALNSVIDNLIVTLGFDSTGQTYNPELPLYSTLTMMKPGFGYWLKVTTADMLIYPGIGPEVVFAQRLGELDKAAVNNKVAASRLWINLYSHQLKLDDRVVSSGAEVKVLAADGAIVGAGTVGGNGHFGFVSVYGDDPSTTDREGLRSGETFNLVVDGVPTVESFTWTGNGDRMEVASLTSQSGAVVPDSYSLHQNYPNPFNPTTTISFNIPTATHATLEVYNILGKKVATLLDGMAAAGVNHVVWNSTNANGKAVASGIYFYRLKTAAFEQTRKMVLMK